MQGLFCARAWLATLRRRENGAGWGVCKGGNRKHTRDARSKVCCCACSRKRGVELRGVQEAYLGDFKLIVSGRCSESQVAIQKAGPKIYLQIDEPDSRSTTKNLRRWKSSGSWNLVILTNLQGASFQTISRGGRL